MIEYDILFRHHELGKRKITRFFFDAGNTKGLERQIIREVSGKTAGISGNVRTLILDAA